MRNLIEFLLKYSSAFLFAFLFAISVALLVSNGRFHSSVWFTSANVVSGKVYGVANSVTGYFNLRVINSALQESNARLENEVLNLQSQLAIYRSLLSDTLESESQQRFDYILATVLANSTRRPRNYFTIDKGSADGVKAGMGVVDHNGIVGIVNVSGKHTARVISLLNTTQHISVRLRGTNVVGTLTWKVGDPSSAYMEEVPRHSVFAKGDTVETSGYSTTFPAGIPVGTVVGRLKKDSDNYYILKVKLASDFSTLSTVRVLNDIYKEEMDSLVRYDISSD